MNNGDIGKEACFKIKVGDRPIKLVVGMRKKFCVITGQVAIDKRPG